MMVIWIGQQFPPDSMQKVFGVPSMAQINTEMVCCECLCKLSICIPVVLYVLSIHCVSIMLCFDALACPSSIG